MSVPVLLVLRGRGSSTQRLLRTQANNNRVRTKYDRLFERKNQNILSEHYTKLIDHGGSDSDDEFLTLKRADHDLDDDGDDGALPESEYTSKRQQRMALSKKALAKNGPRGHKLVFDDAGEAHEVYELKDAGEVFVGGREEAMEAGRRFAESERGKLRAADVADKAEAKEKKREKKRKRKEREREVGCVFFTYLCRGRRANGCACALGRGLLRWGCGRGRIRGCACRGGL